jgi:magnesium transporter
MINTYTYDNETWVDIDSGTPEEIHGLMDKYRIHPFLARELTSVTRKPRVEFHDGYIYCILHFPAWKHSHGKDPNQEVDFIIGKKLLITARYDTIDSLEKFAKTIETKEIIEKPPSITGVDKAEQYIFTNLLKELYSGLNDELGAIEDAVEEITEDIFIGREREMVESISLITRLLLDFKKAVDLHRDVLESLHHYGKKVFGEGFGKEMEMILLDYLKLNNNVHSSLEMLRELRETNNSLLTAKQNETVKQLTAMGFVILPLNLIAWIFAMRVDGLPLLGNPNGFYIVLGMMITSVVITLVYSKFKGWL